MSRKLVINKCPEHGIYSISLDDDGGGLRLTPGKCCGRWAPIKAWEMNAKELRQLANEIECAAEELEHEDA